jgi:hypothetical protein
MKLQVQRKFNEAIEIIDLDLDPNSKIPVGNSSKKALYLSRGEAIYIPGQQDVIPWTVKKIG